MTNSSDRQGLLFILVGPPGVGKNALINALLNETENLRQLATATTRSIRPTEAPGREHHFVSTEQFHKMIDNHELLEWQKVHLNLYGIPRQTVEEAIASGQDLTADIDVLGATYIRSLYPDNVVLIFIKPPSIEDLETRMRTRGEPEDEIAQRMKRVVMEMNYAPLCDYQLVNDHFEQAANRLKEIIQYERLQHEKKNNGYRSKFQHIVSVVGLHDGRVLYRPHFPHFPQDEIEVGELPHSAALRVMQQAGVNSARLMTDTDDNLPHQGSFIPPASINVSAVDDKQQITFTYIVLLNSVSSIPPGWTWVSPDDAGLPQDILEALEPQPELSSSS